jgi:hypothetical protein
MNAVGDTHLRLDGDAGWKTVASDSLYALMALQRLFRAYPSELNPDRAAQVAFATRSLPCYDRMTLIQLTSTGKATQVSPSSEQILPVTLPA